MSGLDGGPRRPDGTVARPVFPTVTVKDKRGEGLKVHLVPGTPINDQLRGHGKEGQRQRDAKFNRIFARPEQVERDEHGNIVINPPGEDSLARATREAEEARAAADAAK
jgi:hypothetical protein